MRLQFVPNNRLVVFLVCALLLVACAPRGIYHTVQPGQTLYRIALTYDVDESYLARVNHIKDPTQLKVSQRLFVPGAVHVRTVRSTAATSTITKPAPAKSPATRPAPTADNKLPAAIVSKPIAKTPATLASHEAVRPSKGIFDWPVKGKLLNSFGTQGKKIHKGIEIGVPQGTTVTAAASGKVIYSGNAIPGYGNLVILEHSDSYFTVYGYNQKCLVKKADHVGQGEKIALSGSPPNGESARLHFEIRKGKSAVNPIFYLP